jgi:hypothetical protein
MSATPRSHLHPLRHPWIWFWVLTAPRVFQLTYADAESRGGFPSGEAVWLTYIKGQITYAVIVVCVYLVVRTYRRWLTGLGVNSANG